MVIQVCFDRVNLLGMEEIELSLPFWTCNMSSRKIVSSTSALVFFAERLKLLGGVVEFCAYENVNERVSSIFSFTFKLIPPLPFFDNFRDASAPNYSAIATCSNPSY